MHTTLPFCQRCGRVGPRSSGMRLGDEGPVRWTLYTCGHVTEQVALDIDPAMAGATAAT